jgi:putative ABC transport system permease protein
MESLVLAAIGGVLGFAVAGGGLRALTWLQFELPATPGAPFVRNLDLDLVTIASPAVLTYEVLLAVAAGLIIGIGPALYASNLGITEVLKGAHAAGLAGRQRHGRPSLRRGLLITQIALAFALLTSAGLLIRTFNRMLTTRIGVDDAHVLTFRIDLPASEYNEQRGGQFLEALTSGLRQLPGVHSVSATNALPLQGQTERTSASIDGVHQTDEAGVHMVDAQYFEALRIPLIRGRLLTERDRADSPRVALVSETAARRFAPEGDVLGRRLSLGLNGWGAPHDAEIVGVVGDVKYQLLTMPFTTDVYLSYMQRPPLRAFFVLRTDGNAAALLPAIRSKVTAIDRALPVYAVKTLSDIAAVTTAGARSTSMLLALFSTMALLLACIGIYGTLAYGVASRTREIGIRIAVGAAPLKVVQLIGRDVLMIGVAGLVLGLLGARLAGRTLAGLLYQVAPNDPAILCVVSLVLLISIALASYLPTRRAVRIDPSVALREE